MVEVKVKLPSYGEVTLKYKDPKFGEMMDILADIYTVDIAGVSGNKKINVMEYAVKYHERFFLGSEPEIEELKDLRKLAVPDAIVIVNKILEFNPLAQIQ